MLSIGTFCYVIGLGFGVGGSSWASFPEKGLVSHAIVNLGVQ